MVKFCILFCLVGFFLLLFILAFFPSRLICHISWVKNFSQIFSQHQTHLLIGLPIALHAELEMHPIWIYRTWIWTCRMSSWKPTYLVCFCMWLRTDPNLCMPILADAISWIHKFGGWGYPAVWCMHVPFVTKIFQGNFPKPPFFGHKYVICLPLRTPMDFTGSSIRRMLAGIST